MCASEWLPCVSPNEAEVTDATNAIIHDVMTDPGGGGCVHPESSNIMSCFTE